jgi:methylthioribose-1-phosphate isomerase
MQGYGTALGLITYLHETGKLGKAYFTQSAPYHQGSRCVIYAAMKYILFNISTWTYQTHLVGAAGAQNI